MEREAERFVESAEQQFDSYVLGSKVDHPGRQSRCGDFGDLIVVGAAAIQAKHQPLGKNFGLILV